MAQVDRENLMPDTLHEHKVLQSRLPAGGRRKGAADGARDLRRQVGFGQGKHGRKHQDLVDWAVGLNSFRGPICNPPLPRGLQEAAANAAFPVQCLRQNSIIKSCLRMPRLSSSRLLVRGPKHLLIAKELPS